MDKFNIVINQFKENIRNEQKNIETCKSLLEAEIKGFNEFSGQKIKDYGKEIEKSQGKIRMIQDQIKLIEMLRDYD